MASPFTKICPECQEEMDLITADDVGEILVYECPECGYQEETRVASEDDDLDESQPVDVAELLADDEADDDLAEPDEAE